jgi:hypothetical protein
MEASRGLSNQAGVERVRRAPNIKAITVRGLTIIGQRLQLAYSGRALVPQAEPKRGGRQGPK